MPSKPTREERLARDKRRRMLAIVIGLGIAILIGVGAWVSTFFHPAM